MSKPILREASSNRPAGALSNPPQSRRITPLVPAAIWLGVLAGFLMLAWSASNQDLRSPNLTISRFVQSLPSGICAPIFWVSNTLGDGWPLALLTLSFAALLYLRGRRLMAIAVFATFGLRLGDVAIKAIVGEPRPTSPLVRVQVHLTDGSFPSGHVVGTTLLAGLVLIALPRLHIPRWACIIGGTMSVLLAVNVGLARVWVGAHWPADVLGGYLYALLFLLPVALIANRENSLRASPAGE